jgi:hypothetical protein
VPYTFRKGVAKKFNAVNPFIKKSVAKANYVYNILCNNNHIKYHGQQRQAQTDSISKNRLQ